MILSANRPILTFFALFFIAANPSAAIDTGNIRQPAAAGTFYPAEPAVLADTVDTLLANAESHSVPGKIVALILPHAGYPYSGHVAAAGFKLIKDLRFERVVLVGPSHFVAFSGISVPSSEYYRTPLGDVPVDTQFAAILRSNSRVFIDFPEAHRKEHALEVEIPFLQRLWPGRPFQILPFVIGFVRSEEIMLMARTIFELIRQDSLVIISADFSHYHPYEKAVEMDTRAIEAIVSGDIDRMTYYLNRKEIEIDAQYAVLSMMIAADHLKAEAKILKYANSGDVATRESVVGYSAIAFYLPRDSG